MKNISLIFFLAVFIPCNFAIATENMEIEYLLSYITGSDCIFIRNGSEHKAREASEHLAMKYSRVKSRINTAEDFIEKIASHSSLTKREYKVRCESLQLSTKEWLYKALISYRASMDRRK